MILLYEYQTKCLEACLNDPKKSQLISMPTGTGKTITFLSLAKKLGKRTLILVHRSELLEQTYDKAKICGYKEDEISLITADKKEEIKILNIGMVQTLARNLEKYNSDLIDVIIVDEAHHATAPSYKKIFDHFHVFDGIKYLFGFTATPLRGDKESLSEIFSSHSFKMTLVEATQLGYIVPVSGYRVEISGQFKDIPNQQGDYDVEILDKIMNNPEMNECIVERCSHIKRGTGIIFTTSVNHAENIARMLREKKIKAISISYKTPKSHLGYIFSLIKQNRVQYIVNVVKLTEGFDYPPIDTIILARPTRSPVLYKQMIGRGLRNSPGKIDCVVVEFSGSDPKMIKWEDIDENCTYQTIGSREKKNRAEALSYYNSIFNSPKVEILDVRVSPFEFYECKIRRYIKYKKFFYFVPFDKGFFYCEMVKSKKSFSRELGPVYDSYGTMIFWEKKYESFYVWDSPHEQMNPNGPCEIHDNIKYGLTRYAEVNRLGKWYPSDYEKVNRIQIKLMQKLGIDWTSISSARKAEMEIENKAIFKAIDIYLSNRKFSGVMEI